MYEDKFKLRLTQLRIEKGVSARDMSLSIGQNAGYINNIETGKALPSMSAFFFICEYLGVTPMEFFDMDSARPKEMRALIEHLKHIDRKHFDNLASIAEALADRQARD